MEAKGSGGVKGEVSVSPLYADGLGRRRIDVLGKDHGKVSCMEGRTWSGRSKVVFFLRTEGASHQISDGSPEVGIFVEDAIDGPGNGELHSHFFCQGMG